MPEPHQTADEHGNTARNKTTVYVHPSTKDKVTMTNTHDHPTADMIPASVQALTTTDQSRLSDTLTAVLDELPTGPGTLDTRLRERFAEAADLLAG